MNCYSQLFKKHNKTVNKVEQELKLKCVGQYNSKSLYSSFNQSDCCSMLKRLRPGLVLKINKIKM